MAANNPEPHSESDSAHGEEHGQHIANENLVVLFMFVAMIIGGLLRVISKKYKVIYSKKIVIRKKCLQKNIS
jgi:hypothetical protein